MVTIAGGVVLAHFQLGVSWESYLQNIPSVVNGLSLGMGVLKSLVFGILIGVISCYRGYHAKGGAYGVGQAVRVSAVQTLVAIIICDFGLSQLFKWVFE